MITFVNPLPGWGHGWTRKMTPSIPIFRNEINALEDFRGGVKVARDFAVEESGVKKTSAISDAGHSFSVL